MGYAAFEEEFGTEQVADVEFATTLLHGQSATLKADLFLPSKAQRPAPLVVWLGPETSRKGTHSHAGHRRLARWLTREGVALATPACRNGAGSEDLDPVVIRRMADAEAMRDLKAPTDMASSAALGAMEDLCCFLYWLEAEKAHFGLSGQVVLAGSGLGAVTALNTGILAPHLGVSRPDPAGIISFSGGCAWPDLYRPGQFHIYALHEPSDTRIPIQNIRRIARLDPAIELIETVGQRHGALGVWPGESRDMSCRRIAGLARRWAASAPAVVVENPMKAREI